MSINKSLVIVLVIALSSSSSYAQIKFEKGYFITNDGKKNNCLIKNLDWENNPQEFQYKESEGGEVKKANIGDVAEFGVYNFSRYIRNDVEIDTSHQDLESLSNNSMPEFKKEKLFLKVLIEGSAILYMYVNSNYPKFFFNTDTIGIQQLIYKSYLISGGAIGENNTFRNQLWSNLQCSTLQTRDFEKLKYELRSLMKAFEKYNACKNPTTTNFEKKPKANMFYLNIRPGINLSKFSITNLYDNSIADFGNRFTFRLGAEAGFFLPFRKNTWSIVVEPTFEYYNSDASSQSKKNTVDYKVIELSAGLRHHFFLGSKSTLCVTGYVSYGLPVGSKVIYENQQLNFTTMPTLAFGTSYYFHKKYGIECKYELGHNILDNYLYQKSNYSCLSVIFSYRLFK